VKDRRLAIVGTRSNLSFIIFFCIVVVDDSIDLSMINGNYVGNIA